jgi:hypothetical protein
VEGVDHGIRDPRVELQRRLEAPRQSEGWLAYILSSAAVHET